MGNGEEGGDHMRQRFAISMTPSPDAVRSYLVSALGYLDDLKGTPSDPTFCVEQARDELREGLEYLGFFEAANEVLILRGVRIEGGVGEKRAVGDIKFRDVADEVLAASAARAALESSE